MDDLTVEELFRFYSSKWKKETSVLSDSTQILNHPCFNRILELGPAVVPYIVEDLKEYPSISYYYALQKITGKDPIPKFFKGSVEEKHRIYLEYDWLGGVISA